MSSIDLSVPSNGGNGKKASQTGEFSLSVPDKKEIERQVQKAVAVPEDEGSQLDDMARQKCEQIVNADLDTSNGRMDIINAVNSMGMETVRESASHNTIMSKRLVNIGQDGGDSGEVAKGLADLAIQMRDLDPSGIDFAKQGPLGKLFNPARRYFEKYKTADAEIADIVESLDHGRQTLKDDNTTLQLEEQKMRDLTRNLNDNVKMAQSLDSYLTDAISKMQDSGEDEDKVKFLQEDVLLPIRQKTMDLQQQMLVNQQGIVAMDVLRRNNQELINSVDRAKTTTIASLRVAVTIAGALYDQKVVIDKVNALNDATEGMIKSTARMLKTQGTEIQRQSMSASVSPETLKQAFSDTFDALDAISNYKQQALPQIANTIQEFQQLADEGNKRLKQIDDTGVFDQK
jgi:uncharacterized protein YaaN involved in tellurite resistance